MFRRATAQDVRAIYRMGRRFYDKHGAIYGIALDFDSFLNTIEAVVQHGVCVVGNRSCAGAIIAPFPFNHRALVASVVFWCFETPREIRVFEALMEHCKADGATHISGASHFPNNRIGRYYRKLGLQETEVVVMGRL